MLFLQKYNIEVGFNGLMWHSSIHTYIHTVIYVLWSDSARMTNSCGWEHKLLRQLQQKVITFPARSLGQFTSNYSRRLGRRASNYGGWPSCFREVGKEGNNNWIFARAESLQRTIYLTCTITSRCWDRFNIRTAGRRRATVTVQDAICYNGVQCTVSATHIHTHTYTCV